MTQVFTNQGLGLSGSSLGRLGNYGPKGGAALGQGGESVYINAANGNMVLRQSDGFLASSGLGFEVIQSYNSLGERGQNWFFNTQTHLLINGEVNITGSELIRVDEDGHHSRFIFDKVKGYYFSDNGGTASLRFSDNKWSYREGASSASCEYNVTGQLARLIDRDGHQLQFSYHKGQLEKIIDNSGKQSVVWTFEKGLLKDIKTQSEGKTIHHLHYDYDEHNRLQKVSRDLGEGKTYWITYNYAGDSDRITAINQSDGSSLNIDYDSEGRVKELKDGEGRITTYTYHHGKTEIKNSSGQSVIYYYDEKGRLTGIDSPLNSPIRYEYQGDNLSAVHQGSLHWFFSYNEAGDCIRTEVPSGQVKTRIYDSEHHLLNETVSSIFNGTTYPKNPKTSRFVYDERGHLRFDISVNGRVTEYRYNQEGQCESKRTYILTSYDLSDLKNDQTLSLKELISWVKLQKSETINLKSYHYDWRGQLDEEVLYTNVNEFGEGIPDKSLIIQYRYDAAGRLVEKMLPIKGGFSTTTYIYDDLGRLILRSDNQNHIERFEYDDGNQRITTTDAKGTQTICIYDRSGLLLSTQYINEKQAYGTIHYSYDKSGRLQSETSVDGKVTYFFYNNEDQLIAKCKPGGALTEFRYDSLGHLVQTIQYKKPVDTKTWPESIPPWAEIPVQDYQDRISQIVYNAKNQIAYQIDSNGAVIAFEYDEEGRIIKKTAYAKRLNNYKSDQILSFESVKLQESTPDRSHYYFYDSEGRLQAEINGEGAAKSFYYDRQGNLLETIQHARRLVPPVSIEWNRPDADKADIHNFSLYNLAGLKIADIDPMGYVTTYEYDERGLLIKKRQFATAITSQKFNEIHENTKLADLNLSEKLADHLSNYNYNDLGQLVEQKEQNGLITRYSYDQKGMVISKTLINEKSQKARQERFRYDALGRISQCLDAIGAAKLTQNFNLNEEQIEAIWQQHGLSYNYDLAGRLVSRTNELNQTTRYYYDESGQLIYTVNANGEVSEQGFNTFNQVEFSYRYSKKLKENVANLTTSKLTELLKHLKNEATDEVTSYEYNNLGLLIKKCTGKKGQMLTAYNSFGEIEETQQFISANRKLVTHYDYNQLGQLSRKKDDVGGFERVLDTKYDIFGRVEKNIDARTGVMRFNYNKRGERTGITNQSQKMKTTKYDAFGRILSETNYASTEINSYTYDDLNNTLTLRHPGYSQIKTQFNAFGDKIELIDGKGKSTHFFYNEKAELIEIKAPDDSSKVYEYDSSGNLVLQLEAKNRLIMYSYDAEGRTLSKIVDPAGLALKTTYHYDGIGRQLEIIEANGLHKQFSYDDKGNLVRSCTDPGGLNLISEFHYDDRGFMVRQVETHAWGKNKITAFECDDLGRRTALIIDPEGLKLTTSYAYDLNDNLISQTDAKNQKSYFIYNLENLCRYQINPRGVVTEHLYSANGKEERTIVYANRIIPAENYSEKELPLLLKESVHDQYRFNDYDALGRLTAHFDALGNTTYYQYDKNDNLTQIIRFAVPKSLEKIKAGDRVTPPSAGQRIQNFAYDDLNRLVYQVDEGNFLTEFSYDDAGLLKSKTKYATHISYGLIKYSLEDIKENIKVSPLRDQYTAYTYDLAGRLSYQASADGSVISYSYDGLGNIIASQKYAMRLYAASLRLANWQEQIKITNKDRMTRFIFDLAGREIYRISPEGRILERRYDDLGNIVAEIAHDIRATAEISTEQMLKELLTKDLKARTSNYSYDNAGRLTKKTDAKDQKTTFVYDGNNNVLSKTELNSAEWTYVYDEENHLIETHTPITNIKSSQTNWISKARSIITRNVYDSFGNISSTIRDAEGLKQTQHFIYDANNRKIKTISPDISVNLKGTCASVNRQERLQTLTEETCYNAFGEEIATKDRANNWRYKAYDNKGQLLYSVDARGALTGYSYDGFGNLESKINYANYLSVTSDFNYNSESIGKAHRVDKKDRQETYSYNQINQLIETRRPSIFSYNAQTQHYEELTPVSSMTYNTFGELITLSVKRNEKDWAKTSYYYDKDGLKTAQLDAEQYLSTYCYNNFGECIEETDYATRATHWDSESKTPIANAKDRHKNLSYDKLGRLTAKTLQKVAHERLLSGSNRYETFVSDLTTNYTYDASGNLTSTTDPLGHTVFYYYDSLNRLITKIGPQTKAGRAATSYSYDSLGQLVETIRHAQGAKEADGNNYILYDKSAKDISQRSIFDNQGKVITAIDGLSHEINYSYDENGNITRSWQLLSQNDGSKRLIDKGFTYDKEAHLLQTAIYKNNGQLKTEDAEYNTFGELIAKGINGKLTTHIEYDKLGRIRRSNTSGHYQIFVYDLTDKITQTVTATNAESREYGFEGIDLSKALFDDTQTFNTEQWLYNLQRQNNEYDGLGHCVRQSKEFTLREGKNLLRQVSESQRLDRWGNMLSHISARGFETRYEYNAFNQVVKQELPEVDILDNKHQLQKIKPTLYFAYDGLGRSIALTDANGHTIAKILEADGATLEEIDALGHKRIKTYDLFGRLASSQNELKGITTYTYDKANHLTHLKTPTSSQSYSYDEAGHLLEQRNALNQSIQFSYDNLDNLILKNDVKNRITNYAYDDSGHKILETDANHLSQSWRYDEQGRLVEHTDLGNRQTFYKYNKNNLLLEETSSVGKNISYRYLGDGQLLSHTDNTYEENTDYDYDADGNMISKSSSRHTQGRDNGWLKEMDFYAYDALGRLTTVRRRHPDDIDNRFPPKDNALLSVDYFYDAVGNIRKTHVEANYTGYQKLINDDYFSYDDNNRMLINKGSLVDGSLVLNNNQGSILVYDEAGNVKEAYKFEGAGLEGYTYYYDNNSRLKEIYKNNYRLKAITYDQLDRIDSEFLYDIYGTAREQTINNYDGDLLQWQIGKTYYGYGQWLETEKNNYLYDGVGNLLILHSTQIKNNLLVESSHYYDYEKWDSYSQSTDKAFLTINKSRPTVGQNTRYYDVNGQLILAVDLQADGTGRSNTTEYKISTFEGIKSRKDKNGQTSYITVAGKIIGDVQLNTDKSQRMNIYGGFTPAGNLPNADSFFSRSNENQNAQNKAELILANSPQGNSGTYTIHSGDSLDSIALQAYGDSSLWYLIADANGISDRQAASQFHTGQRLIIPAVAIKQHQNTNTHQVISNADILGDLSATLPIPTSFLSAFPSHSNPLFKKITIAAISVVATVIAAAVCATLGGALGASLSGGLGQILSLGMKVLSGQIMGTLGSLAAGFTAGVAGNLTGQGLANAFGLQKGLDLKSALITGLSTAVSTGVLQELNTNQAFRNAMDKLDNFSLSSFSLSSAAQMMEQDAVSQGLSLALQKHQHFNWYELGSKAALAGLTGSKIGKDFNQSLNENLGEAGSTLIQSEFSAFATSGMQSAINGSQFDAVSVLKDNLGSAIGSSFLNAQATAEEKRILSNLKSDQESLEGLYCPIPLTEEKTFTPIPAGTYERLHQERIDQMLFNSIKEKANELWNDYGEEIISYGPKFLGIMGSHKVEPKVNTFMTRIGGAFQALEGALETSVGAGLTAFPLTAPVGYGVALHGIDQTLTGGSQLITGIPRNTATHDVLRMAHVSETNTQALELGLSLTAATPLATGKSLFKVTNYGEKIYYTQKESAALKANFIMNTLKSSSVAPIIGYGSLGLLSGSYGAIASGGDANDIFMGGVIGAGVTVFSKFKKLVNNPYISGGISNIAGQIYTNIKDPKNSHFSSISLGFTLVGVGIGNYASHAINVPFFKMMVDTMAISTFGAMGNDLGKKKGY
ncbi:MAG: hypothetical protein H0U57_14025 [Tatlockia sp.]|nr:hypothetical protein [Tatlockia sp.]